MPPYLSRYRDTRPTAYRCSNVIPRRQRSRFLCKQMSAGVTPAGVQGPAPAYSSSPLYGSRSTVTQDPLPPFRRMKPGSSLRWSRFLIVGGRLARVVHSFFSDQVLLGFLIAFLSESGILR